MAPPKSVRTISQEAFDELVKENIEDLEMDPTEALEDAIQTLTLQDVDLSGIVSSILGSGEENPVIQSLERLKELDRDWKQEGRDEKDVNEIVEWLDKLNAVCNVDAPGNAAIASKNGAVELVCSLCGKLGSGFNQALVSALNTLASLLHDLQSIEIFRATNGPKLVMNILNNRKENLSILNSGFSVVSAAATGNEVIKEAFMNLKIDELILQCLREFSRGSIPYLYDAVRVLLTSDDNRVVASEVYGYARRFAKIGIVEALVDSLHVWIKAPSLVSATVALKAIAVNDEICRAVADNGGIAAILQCIDDSGEQGEKIVARTCCSLLSKLAGSDINKSAIVEKDGMDKLMKLATRFSDDPTVLQEVMSTIMVLTLRSPHNAACAVEAGAGDIVIRAMQRFPESELLQRSCCFMIRNLVVRNPENRQVSTGLVIFC
ncbi:putative armadillo repeat-containing protein 6-like isoform X2 [Capsicum annuum]|nr:putative armadillo repeat-containing protein 6-like isoform X2 [Capsicum annuum]